MHNFKFFWVSLNETLRRWGCAEANFGEAKDAFKETENHRLAAEMIIDWRK